MQLIQYAPTTEQVHAVPLLIIPPWINKFYILDLNQQKSLIRWLVGQGHTVFVVSWVNPRDEQRDETWESYMKKGALTAARQGAGGDAASRKAQRRRLLHRRHAAGHDAGLDGGEGRRRA